jgi:NADH:ubiquinone oxidoreductase subunit C
VSLEEPIMTFEQTLARAQILLAPFAVGATLHEDHRVDVVVRRENLLAAVRALADARWGYLITITGLDLPWPKPKPGAAGPPAPASPKPLSEGDAAKAGTMTASDPMEDKLEALYHFAEGRVVATVRVTVPYSDPRLPTICPVVPAATLYERELQEMFGIVVEGTPVPDRLVLPDDWPEGVYPLRKSFTALGQRA